MSSLQFTTFSKLFKKVDCAVSALVALPTIPDLAEAWELRIKYAYALTLSTILSKPTSVKPTDFSKIHRVIECNVTNVIIGPMNTALISPIKFFILVFHRVIGNPIILTKFKKF